MAYEPSLSGQNTPQNQENSNHSHEYSNPFVGYLNSLQRSGGGNENAFPHNENEIAQSEAYL